jgi:hypothetical protein
MSKIEQYERKYGGNKQSPNDHEEWVKVFRACMNWSCWGKLELNSLSSLMQFSQYVDCNLLSGAFGFYRVK